ncbi:MULTISPECIES: flagellar filament capping protein FliD [Citrobacter]|uniref:flagellar filament capping protein FliD n=1 Tax=Citrobacter TaxID=544 RepID=UPI000F68C5E0|nr:MULTISPECIES: flagellar filament capping protein FliD [Citrobacter]MDM2874018.1 flagellar filament capping protein FliD [Citrobacter sp. Cpo069]QXR21473.1 flagellar filament capping protein FliD [Citrobacter freundii]
MASVSSLGVGSNLDLSALLDKLNAAEQQKLTPLTTQQTSYKAQLTAWGVVKSALQKVQTATDALAKADKIATTTVTSKNTAFSATVEGGVPAGNYSVEVLKMAQSQTLTSKEFSSSKDKIGGTTASDSRTITITQPSQKEPMTVTLTDDQTSLTGIRDAINKQNGSVTATIVKADDDSYYLSLTSKDTGVSNAMTVTVTGDDTLKNNLAYDPKATSGNGLKQTVQASDAEVKINDITIKRSSNTIKDAPEGLTLTLLKESEAGKLEQLTVTRDNTAMKAAIQSFVDAYNSLQTTITSQTKYTAVDQGSDKQDSSNGDLMGDGTLRNIQTRLRSMVISAQPTDYATLSSMGITQDVNGKLTVDSTKLDKALNDKPGSVTEFFVGDGEKTGFGVETSALLKQFLANDGAVQSATDGINNSLKKLKTRIDDTTLSINNTIERYKKQFTQLDTLVNKLNNTGNYLNQQFTAMSS